MVCRYKHFPNPPQWFKANDGMWDGRILHSRDGLTYVSYAGPDMVEISGRVMSSGASHQWSVTAEMDTAFGPLNMLLQQV